MRIYCDTLFRLLSILLRIQTTDLYSWNLDYFVFGVSLKFLDMTSQNNVLTKVNELSDRLSYKYELVDINIIMS